MKKLQLKHLLPKPILATGDQGIPTNHVHISGQSLVATVHTGLAYQYPVLPVVFQKPDKENENKIFT